jgi:hypothetical protein
VVRCTGSRRFVILSAATKELIRQMRDHHEGHEDYPGVFP